MVYDMSSAGCILNILSYISPSLDNVKNQHWRAFIFMKLCILCIKPLQQSICYTVACLQTTLKNQTLEKKFDCLFLYDQI